MKLRDASMVSTPTAMSANFHCNPVGRRPAPAHHPLGQVAHGMLERALRRPDAHQRVAAALVVEVAAQEPVIGLR
jgi:hypothetical protein